MSHYISTNRSKHYLKCHLILVTKYRKPLLIGRISDDIQQIVFDCCTEKGIIIDAMESDKDHLHILVDVSPTFSAFDVFGY